MLWNKCRFFHFLINHLLRLICDDGIWLSYLNLLNITIIHICLIWSFIIIWPFDNLFAKPWLTILLLKLLIFVLRLLSWIKFFKHFDPFLAFLNFLLDRLTLYYVWNCRFRTWIFKCCSLIYLLYFNFTLWGWYLLRMLDIFLWRWFNYSWFNCLHYLFVYLIILYLNLLDRVFINKTALPKFILWRIFYCIYYIFCLFLFIYLCFLNKCVLIVYFFMKLTSLFNFFLLIICYLWMQDGNVISDINSLIFFRSKRVFLINCFI